MTHALDMITKIGNNKSLRNKRSFQYAKKKYLKTLKGEEIIYKKATKEELETIKQLTKSTLRKERRNTLLSLIITLLITPIVVFLLIYTLMTVF